MSADKKLREALQMIAWSNDSKWQAQCAAETLASLSENTFKTVCWFKHGPYKDGEQLTCVFEDPQDDVNYSALVFKDAELNTDTVTTREIYSISC